MLRLTTLLFVGLGAASSAWAEAPASVRPIAGLDAQIHAAIACGDLEKADFSGIAGAPTTISSVKIVSGSDRYNEYCQVEGTIAPKIGFEIRLPTKTWNGRYFQTGCGGMCGFLKTDDYCGDALARDFVIAAHDMGHQGSGPWDGQTWSQDPQQRADFAHRSTHAMSVVTKTIIGFYYKQDAARSYFRGCSTGGREAVQIAQYYPDDFDGVIGGDFAMPIRQGAIANTWDAQHLMDEDDNDVFSDAKLQGLHAAVMAKCDDLDGVVDGILMDPRQCKFDPRTIACELSADRSDCLTPKELAAAIALYDGPRNSSGQRLTPGGRALGSELAWGGGAYGGGKSRIAISEGTLRNLAFGEERADFRYRDFNWDSDVAAVERQVAEFDVMPVGTAPDLAAFHQAGRKLILYHGWWDPGVPAVGTLDYYAQVHSRHGGLDETRDWFRVFMVPGMFHCRGGDAPDKFDVLGAMVVWVEQGVPADGIVATQYNEDGSVKRTRPLYAYPAVAQYDGEGDVNDAQNWQPKVPTEATDDLVDWIWAPEPN